jgi:hypothetical protein
VAGAGVVDGGVEERRRGGRPSTAAERGDDGREEGAYHLTEEHGPWQLFKYYCSFSPFMFINVMLSVLGFKIGER